MDDEDRWYGVFQGYRPHGDGVEEVFAGLPDADEYVARIKAVCAASYHDDWARDGYFVVRRPRPATEDELLALGRELLDGLRVLARAAGRESRRLLSLLPTSAAVEVFPAEAFDRKHPDHLDVLDEVRSAMPPRDFGDRVIQLREGFYSVACDFWLAYYLQWPYYRGRVPQDVFRPYFDLWARGYRCAVQGGSLRLARDV